MPDPFWTYQRVSRVLKWYPEIVMLSRPPRNPHDPPSLPPKLRAQLLPSEYENVHLLDDLHRGLARLLAVRPVEATVLLTVYCRLDPDWLRLTIAQRVESVAAELEVTTRTVYRHISAGKAALVVLLGEGRLDGDVT